MNTRKMIVALVLSAGSMMASAGACHVESEHIRPKQCPMDQQDAASCDSCARAHLPNNPSPELSEFYSCYNRKDSGCLQGDGTKCSQNNPDGADQWVDLMDDICGACAAECCYLCASEFGTFVP